MVEMFSGILTGLGFGIDPEEMSEGIKQAIETWNDDSLSCAASPSS